MGNGITAWSPSRLFTYEECPRKARYKFIEKLPDPGGPAMARGTEIHGYAEGYVKGVLPDVHPTLTKVTKLLEELKTGHKKGVVKAELDLAVTSEWKATSWFGPDAWARFKIDILYMVTPQLARVIDWKTGKYKPDGEYSDQLNSYAVAALSVLPTIEETTAQLVFTDHGFEPVERPEGTIDRPNLKAAQDYWTERVEPFFKDEVWVTRPGNSCRWCPYGKAKNGPCEF